MSRHMHFHREIDQLKKMILDLGVLVEDRLRRACTILETKNEAEAQAIMNSDWEIDDMEIRVEEECLKILALHQPVAAGFDRDDVCVPGLRRGRSLAAVASDDMGFQARWQRLSPGAHPGTVRVVEQPGVRALCP